MNFFIALYNGPKYQIIYTIRGETWIYEIMLFKKIKDWYNVKKFLRIKIYNYRPINQYCLVRANTKMRVSHPVHNIQKIISWWKSELIYINYACIETLAFEIVGGVIVHFFSNWTFRTNTQWQTQQTRAPQRSKTQHWL